MTATKSSTVACLALVSVRDPDRETHAFPFSVGPGDLLAAASLSWSGQGGLKEVPGDLLADLLYRFFGMVYADW